MALGSRSGATGGRRGGTLAGTGPRKLAGISSSIGTSNVLAIRASTRTDGSFRPFSYFEICWNVTPIASARAR